MTTSEYVKARLGITTNVRDVYINMLISAVETELTDEKGIDLKTSGEVVNLQHVAFVGDLVVWRYQSRDSGKAMPRHLKWRMNNLFVHN